MNERYKLKLSKIYIYIYIYFENRLIFYFRINEFRS